MGKSVKKTPIIRENQRGSNKKNKKRASKQTRAALKKSDDLLQGGMYKKVVESWGICDYSSRWTEEDAKAYYKSHITPEYYSSKHNTDKICEKFVNDFLHRFPTEESFLIAWKKAYIQK